jgi:methionine-rich copper-binding protein CopC
VGHPGGADQGSELHYRLVMSPRRPPRPRKNRLGDLPQAALPFCRLGIDRRRENPAQYASDICVDERGTSLVRERRHRACRVGADAWQCPKRRGVFRELSVRIPPARGHLDGEAMKVARASVVAETFPCFGHATRFGARHIGQGREFSEKLAVFRDDTRHLRLLKHELRDEDLVWAARPAPRQVASVSAIPGTEPATELRTYGWIDREFALRRHRDQSIGVKKTRFRFNVAVACIALAVVLTPALLFAHARLVRSAPAVNARVSASPTSLSLWFSERPELRYTSIELVDSAGGVIPHGPITSIDSMGVTAPIAATLAPGRYSVAWRTAAADAHGTSGRLAFLVIC